MGYIAEIAVSHEELLLQPTIHRIETVTLRREYELVKPPDTTIFFVAAIGSGSRLRDLLEGDDTITNPRKVVEFGDRTIYSVEVATSLVPVPPTFTEVNGYVLDAESRGTGWCIRSHLPDRAAIVTLKDYYQERDVSFRVVRLHDADGIEQLASAGLSEKHRDLLLTALYSGYYDIPRRASQGDLADQLEVSTSAISKQLRRAISQLIVSSLSPEDTNDRHGE